MAWKTVDVPGLGIVQFPDTMSDEQISAAIRQTLAQKPAEIQAEPKTVGGFARNVLTSGGRQIENLARAVVHPRQTLSGLGTTARGLTQTIKGGPSPGQPDYRPVLGAIAQGAKKRYGSPEAIGNTLYYDPNGAAKLRKLPANDSRRHSG